MNKKITLLFICLISVSVFSQTSVERNKIRESYNMEILNTLEDDLILKRLGDLKIINQKINQYGFKESYYDAQGNYYKLMYFDNDIPIYYKTFNAGSAITARVNHINSGGSAGLNLNGQNMIVGVWDGGAIRKSHVDLFNRVVWKDNENFLISDSETSHAVHVAGTIASSGQNNSSAKGLAYQSVIWGNTFDNDEAEVVQQVSEGLLVSNHSYGIPAEDVPEYYLGAYINESKIWDDIHFNAPYYQAVISAGNDRGSTADTKGGRDLLVGNKNSKNTIVVAAVNNVSNYVNASSVVMSSFSSWGPTDDYRIKPDISAKGVAVFSLDSDSDSDYTSKSGTSMASPAVTATLALFQQHYNNLFQNYMKSATLKAVMICSADEAGDFEGPDHKFGWGLINAKNGAELISGKADGSSIVEELTLTNNGSYTLDISHDGVSPLRVAVVWTDPSGALSTGVVDDPTSRLVNDLDVRVVKGSEINYPWVLNSFFLQGGAIKADNAFDNVEVVDVSNPVGDYQIIVSHKGSLVNGAQNFSLVVSGVNQALSQNEFNNVSLDFTLFPNPTTGEALNLILKKSNSLDSSIDNIKVFDFQYREVLNDVNINVVNSNEIYSIDVSKLAKGVYFVAIKAGESVLYKKFIKD